MEQKCLLYWLVVEMMNSYKVNINKELLLCLVNSKCYRTVRLLLMLAAVVVVGGAGSVILKNNEW